MSASMSLARAHEITCAICARSWATTVAPDYHQPSLGGVTLREMLDAYDIVEAENAREQPFPRTIHVVPAPRLIAAVYAFENYEPSRQAILSVPTAAGGMRMLAVVEQQRVAAAANDGTVA